MIHECPVCSHPHRAWIEWRILSGEPLKSVLVDYPMPLFAHKVDCMEGKDWYSEEFHYLDDPHPEDYCNPFELIPGEDFDENADWYQDYLRYVAVRESDYEDDDD